MEQSFLCAADTISPNTVYLWQLPTFPSVISGSPDFFKNKAASVGPTLPVLPGSTLEQTHTHHSLNALGYTYSVNSYLFYLNQGYSLDVIW